METEQRCHWCGDEVGVFKGQKYEVNGVEVLLHYGLARNCIDEFLLASLEETGKKDIIPYHRYGVIWI